MALHSLNAPPAASFDAPLDMLLGCHGRILQFCDSLERLAAYLPVHGADAQAVKTADGIVRYFNSAGKLHHQDEEQDLFPRLKQLEAGAAELIESLLSAHVELDQCWQSLLPMLTDLAQADHDRFQSTATRFIELNRAHVELENRTLLPLARRLLNSEQLQQLGKAMARRRNVDYVSHHSGPMA